MRKIILALGISIDGYIARLDDTFDFLFMPKDFMHEFAAFNASIDTIVMGRKTYDVFATSWPTRPEDDTDMGRFTARMNSMQKYVASTTLKDPDWNNTQVLDGDLADAVRELKERPGQNIVMYGAGPVARELVKHGLVDEFHLWVHPVVVGSAGEEDGPFAGYPNTTFELIATHPLDSGVVVLVYKPSV